MGQLGQQDNNSSTVLTGGASKSRTAIHPQSQRRWRAALLPLGRSHRVWLPTRSSMAPDHTTRACTPHDESATRPAPLSLAGTHPRGPPPLAPLSAPLSQNSPRFSVGRCELRRGVPHRPPVSSWWISSETKRKGRLRGVYSSSAALERVILTHAGRALESTSLTLPACTRRMGPSGQLLCAGHGAMYCDNTLTT